MSETKTITCTVVSTQHEKFTVNVTGKTWGDLKYILRNKISNINDFRAIERVTKVTFERDEALLPTEDFIIFLVPKEVKSGVDNTVNKDTLSIEPITIEEVDSMNYNVLRSTASKAGISVHGKKEEIKERFKEYLKGNTRVSILNKKVKNSEVNSEEISLRDLSNYASEYEILPIDKKLNILKTRFLTLTTKSLDQCSSEIIKEIEDLRNTLLTAKEEINTMNKKSETISRALYKYSSFVESISPDIIELEAEVVEECDVVKTSVEVSNKPLEQELQDLVQKEVKSINRVVASDLDLEGELADLM